VPAPAEPVLAARFVFLARQGAGADLPPGRRVVVDVRNQCLGLLVGGELVDNHTHQAHPYDATRTCSEAHISLKYFAVSMVYSILLGMAHTALCGRTPNRRYLPKLRECAELIVSRHTKAKKINTQPCLAQKEE